MGRKERRALERENRRNQKMPNNYRPKKKEIENIINETSENNVELLMTCFGLSLYDEFGFGEKRITRCLNKVNDYMNKIINDEESLITLQKRLENNTGISIKCE